ncbi:hypothetical protein [Pseudophaeobacter sp.]|uniref:hypothetical protein n=1 Tax=Pseudophaeobacter sp. TaxID=1971739 RepID=UPI0040594781
MMHLARLLAVILCLSALPLTAWAGAWKRPVDTGFSATTFTLRRTETGLENEFAFYRDFGVSPLFDLGIDLNQAGLSSGHVMLFARLPLRQQHRGTRIATELALGTGHSDRGWNPMYRFTLSAGRSFSTKRGRIWSSLDLNYEKRGHEPDPLWKLDASFGVQSGRRVAPMLQFETAFGSNRDLSYAVIPSLRIKLSGLNLTQQKRFEDSEVTIGLEYRRTAQQSLGLRIGLWRRF